MPDIINIAGVSISTGKSTPVALSIDGINPRSMVDQVIACAFCLDFRTLLPHSFSKPVPVLRLPVSPMTAGS
jgi:hypothetical protein